LTRAQFENDPRQAGFNAETYNTRKSVRQQQLGANYQRQLSADDSLAATVYGGRRSTEQFQALAAAAQNSAASAGGVIDLQRQYWGSDWHWTHRGAWLGGPTEFTGGFSYDTLSEARRGYQNFVGSQLGIVGQLRRDESNRVYNFDQYAQLQWEPGDSWLLIAGLRNSRVPIKSRDHYIVPGNGDDSGSTEYNATTPVLGITYRFSDALHFYADYGKGFETPTLNELAYKSTSGADTGLNLGLNPSRSEHYEIGAKARFDEIYTANLAAFHVITHDELAVAANVSGRSVYQNVGKTQRDGIEASFDSHWQSGIGLALAYTVLRAKYVEDFTSCPGSPCTAPQLVSAGNRIPGVPLSVLFGELSWQHQPSGFSTAFEVRRETKMYVNDLNSDAAPAYTALNWRGGFAQQLQQWHLQEFIRVENLTDRKYAGSVIVNESSARYFEPAPGRNVFAGVHAEFDW
jgi:iron complex outermembrane receptor protein